MHQIGVDLRPLPKTWSGNRYIITTWLTISLNGQKQNHYQTRAERVALFLYTMICRYVSGCDMPYNYYFTCWRCHCMEVYSSLLHIPFFCRYGCTKILISDQGREFVNKVNESLFQCFKTEDRASTAYHPQTNGLVERYNQTLQRSLVKLVNKEQHNWDEYIDGVLFAYRTAKQSLPSLLHLSWCTAGMYKKHITIECMHDVSEICMGLCIRDGLCLTRSQNTLGRECIDCLIQQQVEHWTRLSMGVGKY